MALRFCFAKNAHVRGLLFGIHFCFEMEIPVAVCSSGLNCISSKQQYHNDLIISRICGKYGGARIGAKLCKMPVTVQKYLGLTLLPHSGVSLVFTGIISSVLASTQPELAAIVTGTIAAAVINEIIAVIASKKGFELAGEIKGK